MPASTTRADGTFARFVHISDLHFGVGFDDTGWNDLCDFVAELSPDLLIVSGDVVNSPWPYALTRARNELRALAERAHSQLVIVPGNHDVALIGNVKVPLLRQFFLLAFGTDAKRPLLDAVPSYSQHARLGRATRWALHLYHGLRLWPWFLWQASRSQRGSGLLGLDLTEKSVLLRIDSNQRLRAAGGRITTRSVSDINEALRGGLTSHSQPFLPRIAVVHHHPVGIAGSDSIESLTSFDPFLALRNGAMLLRILGAQHWDLVLHGHKHFAGITRVSYDLQGDMGGEVVVIAAASAGVSVTTSTAKTVGIVEVARSGRIAIEVVRWGLQNPPRRTRTVPLQSIPEFKHRMYQRGVQIQKRSCEDFIRKADIDEFGVATVTHEMRGLRGQGAQIKTIQQRFSTTIGRILPEDIGIVSSFPDATLALEATKSGGSRVKVSTTFTTPLPADQSLVGSLQIRYTTHNAFLLSAWEAAQREQIGVHDTFGGRVSLPTKRLTLEIRLPESLLDDGIEPRIRCRLPRNYPCVDICSDTGQLELPADPVPTEEDLELTEFESQSGLRLSTGQWRFQVDYPLVGAVYEVYWPVKAPWERKPVSRSVDVAHTQALRDQWLAYAREARAGSAKSRIVVRQKLDLFRNFLAATFRPPVGRNDQNSMTLHIYDPGTRGLVVAETVRSSQEPPSWDFVIPLGDGIAGSAFKQGRVLIFGDSGIGHAGLTRGWVLYQRHGELATANRALLAIPLYCPHFMQGGRISGKTRPDPEATVGVLTFGSTSTASGLIALATNEQSNSSPLSTVFAASQAVFKDLSEADRAANGAE